MKSKIKKTVIAILCVSFIAGSAAALSACSKSDTVKIKALIIPKFEIDDMARDFPGETQLFYEKYCMGLEPTELKGLPSGSSFFVNKETGVAILITGEGKTAAGLATSAVLLNDKYDTSKAYIISVGCAGGSTGYCTLGDVVLVTGVCDNDLGHSADIREYDYKNAETTWFYDAEFDWIAYKKLNTGLTDTIYEMTKDIPLRTTQISKKIMRENFPGEEWANREPKLIKGTAVTSDNYWKGRYFHNNAEAVAAAHGCEDPYAVTEMEEIAIANAAECAGLLDRVISIRVVVNTDTFFDGESPEGLWGTKEAYDKKIKEGSSETLDVFEPAMHNLFDVASPVIDAAVSGGLDAKDASR